MNEKYSDPISPLINLCGLLSILFIALKLLDKIDWSWWCVLGPLWMPAVLVGILFIIVNVLF